jgi:hypothetical protein
MPLERRTVNCEGKTASGRACSRRTTKYPKLCWQHFRKKTGLKIEQSGIPNAGDGVFTTRRIPANKKIADYTGRETKQPPPNTDYTIGPLGRDGHFLTSTTTQDAVGKNINDCKASNRRAGYCRGNNARIFERGSRVYIRAMSRPIPANTEIFVSYGRDYWRNR